MYLIHMFFRNVADRVHAVFLRCEQHQAAQVGEDHFDRFNEKQAGHDDRYQRINVGSQMRPCCPAQSHLYKEGDGDTEAGDDIQFPDVDFCPYCQGGVPSAEIV